jgi:hypothetical protein
MGAAWASWVDNALATRPAARTANIVFVIFFIVPNEFVVAYCVAGNPKSSRSARTHTLIENNTSA